ncbi:MAG: ABC transporter substrate-binding protein [Candidatus Zixiibacteriota bacterium]
MAETKAQTVVFLASDSLTYTRRTINGAKRQIIQQYEKTVFHEYYLNSNNPDENLARVDSINKNNPALIFTVGSSATAFAKKHFERYPIVFSSVMYPVMSGFVESFNRPGGNITGASLNIQADVQFHYFKKIIPDLKKIGVLYTSNTAALIPPAKVIANSMGLELVALEINTEKELPKALDSLAKTVDGLWSVADPNLFNPQSTKYILLNSLRKGIPFMGFSRHVVESGALFAIDFDYKAIGRQAGDIANRVIAGEKPAEISVTSPDVRWFHYNEKTAGHLNITIPEELAAVAKEVYR